MVYCPTCQKFTDDVKEKTEWNSKMNMVTIHCAICNTFNYQYLEEKEEVSHDQ